MSGLYWPASAAGRGGDWRGFRVQASGACWCARPCPDGPWRQYGSAVVLSSDVCVPPGGSKYSRNHHGGVSVCVHTGQTVQQLAENLLSGRLQPDETFDLAILEKRAGHEPDDCPRVAERAHEKGPVDSR